MPGKIKVKVLAGRNLPVMDRAADTTDAFVEIKFGGVTHKTDVCRKSLNPHWNSTEWYRFEVDDSELQDEPLQLRLMDHDTYTANDAIGKVVVSLAPLLAREPLQPTQRASNTTGAIMSGWIPVFDTMHGIRGELNVIVKVELFSDVNKFRQSSCGVRFFHCPLIPPGYRATSIHGFVEELIVNDDPEYQWIDKIRTPRASNEARQVAFIKLSNQVQRRVGLKAAEMGANAVVAYKQSFDLEGESGVVARAIGTAVSIVPLPTACQPLAVPGYTQQQLRKYLEILAMDDENITDLNAYFQTHGDQLQKLIHILYPSSNYIDDQDGEDDKSLNLTRQTSIKNYAENLSIYQEDLVSQQSLQNIAEDLVDLRKLLNPGDDSFDEPKSTFNRIKKFSQTSQGFFSKKLATIRRRSDRQSDDQISIKSNSSDSSRISLLDIKNEFKKLKRLRKPKFRRSVSSEEDEGMGMASVLARSILHAHTSLACIAETQDSENSPCSTLKHRASGSEPAINISDDECRKTTERENTSIAENIVTHSDLTENNDNILKSSKKISNSCPVTPISTQKPLLNIGEEGYFGSVSSAVSGESTEPDSSSEEDEDSSEVTTDSEHQVETVTSLVQSVLHNQPQTVAMPQKEKEWQDRSEKSISSLAEQENTNTDIISSESTESTRPVAVPINIPPATPDLPSTYFKFHNIFAHKSASKSISLPASPEDKKGRFMSLTSLRIRRQLSRISKTTLIHGLTHIKLKGKKKDAATLSPSASNSDVKYLSNSRQTVLGSPFLSYSDLIGLMSSHGEATVAPISTDTDKPFSMYIGSEPASPKSLSGFSSPVKSSLTKSDDINKFNEKRKRGSSTEPTSPTQIKPSGLLHTAMETILMDKVQSLMIPTSPPPTSETQSKEKQFFKDINEKLEKIDSTEHHRKLVRQNSVDGSSNDSSKNEAEIEEIVTIEDNINETYTEPKERKMSEISFTSSREVPLLQHLHPVMSGAYPKLSHLETIPSLPESSFDRSIDDGKLSVDLSVSNQGSQEGLASVCDNLHAECVAPCDRGSGSPRGIHSRTESCGGKEHSTPTAEGSAPKAGSSLSTTTAPVGMTRRSSDSDISVTPKGGSLNTAGLPNMATSMGAILRTSMNANNLEMLEYPFLTMTEYPPNFIVHLGGMVTSRAVKLIDGAEYGTRDSWWAEVRTELRAHMRALRCTAVLGYQETAAICEDVCVLSASGTAAVIDLETDFSGDADLNVSVNAAGSGDSEIPSGLEDDSDVAHKCSLAHVPFSPAGMPYSVTHNSCSVCGKALVNTCMLSTVERPAPLAVSGRSCLVTAAAARARRAPAGEPGARDISDQLPFLEYELHKLLFANMLIQGANALFGVKTQIAIGEKTVVALATGTGAYVNALPPPKTPTLKPSEEMDVKETTELQKGLNEALNANRLVNGFEPQSPSKVAAPADLSDELQALDLCGDKAAFVLELDESEDVQTARALATQRPRRLCAATTQRVSGVRPLPGARPHHFTQMWRTRLSLAAGDGGGGGAAERHVTRALDGIHYKLRRLAPAALGSMSFQVDLPEDEMQLLVSGVAVPLQESSSCGLSRATTSNDDTIFTLDEEAASSRASERSLSTPTQVGWTGIAVTPLPRVAGARCQRWLCALQLLFVRETGSVRELGGLSGLLHTFITEVLAIVRAYTAALGGNVLASFYLTVLMLQENPHKNQGQCLLSVGGDIIHVTY